MPQGVRVDMDVDVDFVNSTSLLSKQGLVTHLLKPGTPLSASVPVFQPPS